MTPLNPLSTGKGATLPCSKQREVPGREQRAYFEPCVSRILTINCLGQIDACTSHDDLPPARAQPAECPQTPCPRAVFFRSNTSNGHGCGLDPIGSSRALTTGCEYSTFSGQSHVILFIKSSTAVRVCVNYDEVCALKSSGARGTIAPELRVRNFSNLCWPSGGDARKLVLLW